MVYGSPTYIKYSATSKFRGIKYGNPNSYLWLSSEE